VSQRTQEGVSTVVDDIWKTIIPLIPPVSTVALCLTCKQLYKVATPFVRKGIEALIFKKIAKIHNELRPLERTNLQYLEKIRMCGIKKSHLPSYISYHEWLDENSNSLCADEWQDWSAQYHREICTDERAKIEKEIEKLNKKIKKVSKIMQPLLIKLTKEKSKLPIKICEKLNKESIKDPDIWFRLWAASNEIPLITIESMQEISPFLMDQIQ
jgi:hypothetical protein